MLTQKLDLDHLHLEKKSKEEEEKKENPYPDFDGTAVYAQVSFIH
tara:strand:+ start:572 stop:706 length:135 start_codon:yes stop_codon:yes gene_type:complete